MTPLPCEKMVKTYTKGNRPTVMSVTSTKEKRLRESEQNSQSHKKERGILITPKRLVVRREGIKITRRDLFRS